MQCRASALPLTASPARILSLDEIVAFMTEVLHEVEAPSCHPG
jgi:hypothetical protein